MTDFYVVCGKKGGRFDANVMAASGGKASTGYAAFILDDNRLEASFQFTPEDRPDLEEFMQSFRGTVHVDPRLGSDYLLELDAPSGSVNIDMEVLRRPKPPDAAKELIELYRETRQALTTDRADAASFRGACTSYRGAGSNTRTAFTVREGTGFREYRGGLKTESGWPTDLTVVETTNRAWSERMRRVESGLREVRPKLKVGASVDELNQIFRGCLDPTKDELVGDCIVHVGYDAGEVYRGRAIERNDLLRTGGVIKDLQTGEHAAVFADVVHVHAPNNDELLRVL
jgi:hypothetical protein